MPEIGVATVKLLRRAGCQVTFPQAQTCCGQPFFNSGFREEAKHLAKRTIAAFADQEAVVLPSGSCTGMMREEYAHLLADEPEWANQAHRLAAKTYELSEFLQHHTTWDVPQAASSRTITYHDSCHMCRMLGLRQEPRSTLSQAGCAITEMAEADRCCGFGGLFSVRMPEVSNAMTGEKLRQAKATQTEMLVTADPGCLMQMRGLAVEAGVQVEHLATVLEEMTR
jgi:L-lactate dehydrogenase complex protein LldE